MKVGGLIVAAGLSSRMQDFKPMMKIGNQSIIQRVISTFKTAGLDPIVVITGFKGDQLEEHLADMPVVCIRNKDYGTTEMFDSVKMGLAYLENRCETLLFTPGDIPLFSIQSINALLASHEKLAKPVCNGKGGHPLKMDASLIHAILSYNGEMGLKGAIQATNSPVKAIEVADSGVLLDADTREDYEALVSLYRRNEHSK
jgi:CTP:molybdopterin cytidylyltransferase MocA